MAPAARWWRGAAALAALAASLGGAQAGPTEQVDLSDLPVPPEVERALEDLDESIKRNRGSVVTPEHEFKSWLGTHYIFELMNITNVELASNAKELEQTMLEAARAGDLSILSSAHHQFSGKGEGATAYVVLAESHFAVHTWPELRYVAADIFTCGAEAKAKAAAAFLAEKMGADVFVGARLPRGVPGKLALNQLVLSPAATVEEIEKKAREGEEVVNSLAEYWAGSMTDEDLASIFSNSQGEFDVLENLKSKYQQIEFIKNKENGDICLVLDGTVQICESYNAAYSEVYVHLPAAYLHQLKNVLIIGGGDALALREVLKYSSVERVVQLELDEMIPELCEKHFDINAHLPGNPDTDPRVEWRFGDAAKTIVDLVNAGERFDLLLLDISETDPSGTVSTEDFFRHVARALAPTGIFIKNENYQQATAKLFDEYLEIVYPVPVITQQTFILGSNGTSLLLPNFQLLEENDIQTSFLAHGPASRFRQLRAITRRYSKRGLNYEAMATDEFENRNRHSPWVHRDDHARAMDATINGGTCPEPDLRPCFAESKNQPKILLQKDWRTEPCSIPPETDSLQLELSNLSPSPVEVAWIHTETGEPHVVLPRLAPGESKRINTYFGHSFAINDLEHQMVVLAQLKIVHQLASHAHVGYFGVHDGLAAGRSKLTKNTNLRRAVAVPMPSP